MPPGRKSAPSASAPSWSFSLTDGHLYASPHCRIPYQQAVDSFDQRRTLVPSCLTALPTL